MLDSEESSSSAASAIALAVASSSADENSNEITPNLDAPKFSHNTLQRHLGYRNNLDNTLDNLTDNASIIDPNETLKNATMQRCNNFANTNSNSSSSFDAYLDERKTAAAAQQIVPAQHKKIAILGAGAGIVPLSSSSSSNSAHNSNSNSPSAGRGTRSPLAVVSSNSNIRNASHSVSNQYAAVQLPQHHNFPQHMTQQVIC